MRRYLYLRSARRAHARRATDPGSPDPWPSQTRLHRETKRLRNPLPLICLFLSGFAGLVYEVCWIRQGTLVFGSTTLSTSTVLAVFFAGLALGSFLFGRLSARLRHPLRSYAYVELAIAVLGLASLVLFPLADDIYGRLFRALGDGSTPLGLLRVLLVSAILLPAATGMGATLPLMCAAYASRAERGSPVAVFYGVNTLGAAVGVLATGLFLIPTIGITQAIVLAAVANVLAATMAWRMRLPGLVPATKPHGPGDQPTRRPPRRPEEVPVPHSRVHSPGFRFGISALFFLSGFVALAHEVLWTRFLALLVRNTVVTFTISLTVVLLGIVIGSLVVSRVVSPAGRSKRSLGGGQDAWTFGALQILIGLYVLTLMLLPPAAWQKLGTGLGIYFLLLLPPAALSGASFPIAVRMVAEESSALGYEVGRMAALNIMGGIAGSLFAGFLGLPHWGIEASARVTTGLSLAVGIAAWFLPGFLPMRPRHRARDTAVAVAALLLWLAVPRALGTRIPQDFLAADGPLVDFREGMLSNVAIVRSEDALQMMIDRWWQGQDRKTHQIMAAHVPMLLHPDPRTVLVVGVGTGQTASRFLYYPIRRLDVVDIEPVVFDLIRPHFEHRWLDDPRVHLIREDGRNYVAHTDRKYDVISLEIGQVFRPGVASFYTHEFYARVLEKLAPGGVLCQFVPLPFLTFDQFRGVIATFFDVFPQATLWYNTSELLLIGGSDGPQTLGEARLGLLGGDARISDDLRYSHWGGPSHWLNQRRELLAMFLCGPRGLKALAQGAARYHDDRPVLEYATTGVHEGQTLDVVIAELLREFLDSPGVVLEGSVPAESLRVIETARSRNLSNIAASALIRQASPLEADGRYPEIEALLQRALRINPGSLSGHRGLASVYQRMNRPMEAKEQYESALHIDPQDVPSLRGLGTWHLARADYAEARSAFQTVLALRPDDVDAHNNLGAALGSLGDLPGAAAQFKEALRLRPTDGNAASNLKRVEAALGARPDRAP
jgi:spermidine synthase